MVSALNLLLTDRPFFGNPMEINQLRYFLTVAELGSFSKAAACCHISQPSLSIQIQKLESEVGKQLLERTRRKIAPTEPGRILLGRAKRILAQLELAKREIQASDKANTGSVTIGVLPTIAPYFLPSVLQTFREHHPKIRLSICEEKTARLLQMIEENQLDFAFACPPIREYGLEIEKLFSEELLLALPQQHPLAQKEKIHLKDLDSECFILLQEGHCVADQILDFCSRHGFRPRIVLRGGQISTIQSLIKTGMGVSLIPQMAASEDVFKITYRSLERPQPRRVIAVVKRRGHRPKKPVEDFLQHLRHWKKPEEFNEGDCGNGI